MGIWSWIKNAFESAGVTEKERAYWWVSEARRKKCRKILDESIKEGSHIFPWDAWHKCMQQEIKPASEWKVVKDFKWIARFIEELAGVRGKTEVIELPAKKRYFAGYSQCVKNKKSQFYNKPICINYRREHEKAIEEAEKYEEKKKEAAKKESERVQKIIEKAKKKKKKFKPAKTKVIRKKIRAKKIYRRDRSNLSFRLFAGGLGLRNLLKPEFLIRMKNINKELLEEISMNKKT